MSKERFANLPIETLYQQLGASPHGLSSDEAARRLAETGSNDALNQKPRPLWREILVRFANPLILILLFASALSAWTGELASFILILVIISISVVLDLVQQVRADAAVDLLRASVALMATVLRDGRDREVAVTTLVPGDVVRLTAGDIVPADCRLVNARDFFVNQGSLTGESYPVEKRASEIQDMASVAAPDVSEATNSVFMGTAVITGTALAIVCRTGRATEIGKLAGRLRATRPPDAFETGIRRFGFIMLRFTVFLVLFVLAANAFFHRPWLESLLFALALAVGLTPELLPMVVTVTLSRGARRLSDRRVIVKRLAAVHDLGAMTVLCTDKTGTLTRSEIELREHVGPDGQASARALWLARLNSHFESGLKSPLDEAILRHGGESLEGWHKVDEVPFDFERRRVSVLVSDGMKSLLAVKGAPEDLIQLATHAETSDGVTTALGSAERVQLMRAFEQLGERGLRVLAVAYRELELVHVSAAISDETSLTFSGFLAFIDPPKSDAAQAIRDLGELGVEVKILTGDNERITQHICREIGVPVKGVLTGRELGQLSEEALCARLRTVNLFCRVTPQQKERVILALKKSGETVGFLGDGINDASALHAADAGISVDRATDVAKEAADLVLLDHDLGVVREGVIEGRRTVENVTKYILMGASSNLGNMVSMAGAALFLPFLPMLPAQVLLNNLLYDLSEIGVPFDNVDPEALARPVTWDLRAVERFMLVLGPVSSLFDFLTFYALIQLFGASEAVFQTGWFLESLATQALVIFVIRTRGAPWKSRPHPLLAALSLGAVAAGLVIPMTPLGTLFEFTHMPGAFYVFLVTAVVSYLGLAELVKRLFYRRQGAARWAT